jgi:hypothetical protein
MPAYNTVPVAALYQGTQIACVNNAAVDTNVTTTQQLAVAPPPNGAGLTVMITNTTNQQAVGQFSWVDTAADYVPLSGCVIGPGTALAYNLATGWLRFTFATAPSSGSLIVSR